MWRHGDKRVSIGRYNTPQDSVRAYSKLHEQFLLDFKAVTSASWQNVIILPFHFVFAF